jgi:LDH2 family malate/lactate/ureidoglycolate dehydrogenase
VDEVFYPGELEHIREIERLRDGCVIEDTTWAKLKEVAEKYNVSSKLSFD